MKRHPIDWKEFEAILSRLRPVNDTDEFPDLPELPPLPVEPGEVVVVFLKK